MFYNKYTVLGDVMVKEKYRLKQELKNGAVNIRIFEAERYGAREAAVKQLERIYREYRVK